MLLQEEEGQARRQLEVAEPIIGSGRNILRIADDAEQELGTRQQPPERELDPRLEAARVAPLVVKAEQDIEVAVGDRPTICTPGKRRQDIAHARQLVTSVPRSPVDK